MARMSRMRGLVAVATVALSAGGAQAQAAPGGIDEKAAAQIAALQALKRSQSGAERKLDSRLALTCAGARAAPPPPARRSRGPASASTGRPHRGRRARGRRRRRPARPPRSASARSVTHASPRVDSVRATIPLSALAEVGALEGRARGLRRRARDTHQRSCPRATRRTPPTSPARATGSPAPGSSCARSPTASTRSPSRRPRASCPPSTCSPSEEGERRRGHGDAGDPARRRPERRARLRHGVHQRRLVRRQHPRAALRGGLRRDRRRRPVLQRASVPGRPDRAVGRRGHRRRRAVLQLRRQRGQRARRDLGQLRGRLRRARAAASASTPARRTTSIPARRVQVFEPFSPESSAGIHITLFWADPLGASRPTTTTCTCSNAASNVVAFSQDVQDGDDDPYEILGHAGARRRRLRLAVVKFSGADRYFQLVRAARPVRELRGRARARMRRPASPAATRRRADAFSTAAAPAAAAALPFASSRATRRTRSARSPARSRAVQLPERFTSDGPRRMFFEADGTPITPGDFSSTGGEVRQKPDITAADGVTTSVDGFEPFFGTSAAAPHAAAIAGLVLSGNPDGGTADVREAFEATALDLAPAGVDGAHRRAGSSAPTRCSTTRARRRSRSSARARRRSTPLTGDGDAYLEPGETATLDPPRDQRGRRDRDRHQRHGRRPATRRPRSRRARGPTATSRAGATTTRAFQLALAPGFPLRQAGRAHGAGHVRRRALADDRRRSWSATGQPAADGDDVRLRRPARPDPRQRRRPARRWRSRSRASATRRS